MSKRNVTVAVDEDAYYAARAFAAVHDTSISHIVEYCIQRLPGLPIAQMAADAIQGNRSSRRVSPVAIKRMEELTLAIDRLSAQLVTVSQKIAP